MAFFGPDEIAHFEQDVVRVGLLIRMDFKAGPWRGWTGNTVLDAGGNAWQPTFGMAQIDGLGWTGEPVARQVTLSVSGVDERVLSATIAETEEADQRPLTISMQLFDDRWQTFGTAFAIFRGLMQPPSVSQSEMEGTGGATRTVSVAAENAFIERSRPAYGRYTSSDQNSRTGVQDDFLNFVPSLTNKTFKYPDY